MITEGTNAAALYMLKEGKVAIRMTSRSGHEVVIDELGPGDVFGWSAVLDHQLFKAAIWTVEDCTLIVMDGVKLRQLFEANNHIGYRAVRVVADIIASRLEGLRARLVDQPFSQEYLAPVRTSSVPVTGEKSEMRSMKCPECSTGNRPFSVVNETEQYRCKSCGMVYYSPVGCETGPAVPSADKKPEPVKPAAPAAPITPDKLDFKHMSHEQYLKIRAEHGQEAGAWCLAGSELVGVYAESGLDGEASSTRACCIISAAKSP